jgi:TnpA family transposase
MLTPMSPDLLEPRRFTALHGDWPPEDLGHFFWLTPDDLLQVRSCRGAANRLGFALNLLLLRFLHYPLPSLDRVPDRVVQFVAMQLNTPPGVVVEYGARRKQTRDVHLVQIRAYLGMRLYVHERDDQRLAAYLLSRALERDDPAVLLEAAEDWLRDDGILFPAESTLQNLITQARPQADVQLFAAITRQLNPFQSAALDELLQREEGKHGSTLAWLKEPPVLASPASVKNLLKKLQMIRATRVLAVDLSALNRNRVRVLAHLGRKYHRDALQRFSTPKRTALLACFLQDLHHEVLDHLLTSFQDLLTAIFRRTEQAENKHHVVHGRALTRHVHTMRKAVQIILDPEVPDELVRPTIFVTTPKLQLQAAYDDSGAIARPDAGQTIAFDLLEKRYSFLRKFLPDLLRALEFAGTQAAQPVTKAIAALKQMDTEGRRTLPPGAPMAFLPPDWRSGVDRAADAGGSGRARGSHDPQALLEVVANFGALFALFLQGEVARAEALAQEGAHLAHALGLLNVELSISRMLFLVALQREDLERARELASWGLRTAQRGRLVYLIPPYIGGFAYVASRERQHVRAARLMGASIVLMSRHSSVPSTAERAAVFGPVQPSRDALGEEYWQAALLEGEALTLDEAIAEALGEVDSVDSSTA